MKTKNIMLILLLVLLVVVGRVQSDLSEKKKAKIENEMSVNMDIPTELKEATKENMKEPIKQEYKRFKLYVGDSRFVGMNKTCKISEKPNNVVIAEVGQGLKYFNDICLKEIYERIVLYNSIDNISNICNELDIIIGLGVNDPDNISGYIQTYEELINKIDNDNIKVYFISVNPLDYSKYITNDDIEKFNLGLQNFVSEKQKEGKSNIEYIDTYTMLQEEGYETVDGIHFTNDTYKQIYNYIENSINKDIN